MPATSLIDLILSIAVGLNLPVSLESDLYFTIIRSVVTSDVASPIETLGFSSASAEKYVNASVTTRVETATQKIVRIFILTG
jgi:hypothetical protein